jgi:hypothetical protein
MSIDDQDLLRFVAAHEVVVAIQAARLRGMGDVDDVAARLEGLRDQGLVSRLRVSPQSPAGYRVTPDGAARVDPALPELTASIVGRYRHHLGVGWLWLAAQRGAFGKGDSILSAREMRAADATGHTGGLLDAVGATFGVALPGRPSGELAYPDLAVMYPNKYWLGVHLLYALPDSGWLRTTMQRYVPDEAPYGLFIVEGVDNLRAVEEIVSETGKPDSVLARELLPDVEGG